MLIEPKKKNKIIMIINKQALNENNKQLKKNTKRTKAKTLTYTRTSGTHTHTHTHTPKHAKETAYILL